MQIEEEIQNIDKKVYAMLDAVIDSCKVAFGYYLDKDRGYDAGIEIDDDKINLFERETESLCMQILLREKVYSGDLRDIIGNFRLVEDVERIGDQAYDIKKTTDRIKNLSDVIKVVKGMDELVAVVQKMVQDALYCCVKMNVEQAKDILARDDYVDGKFWEIVDGIIALAKAERISPENVVYQTMIVKYLERIADHATNIAEWVVFMVNGYHKDQVII